MNSIILYPEEVRQGYRCTIKGARAKELLGNHDLVAGVRIRAGELKGKRGFVTIERIVDDSIELLLDLSEPPLPRFPTSLIVGVPRPQTVKKVVNTASSMGVSELHFIKCENVEKSYLGSHALLPSEIDKELIKGLEQAGDTVPPSVHVHMKFKTFIEDKLVPSIKDGGKGENPLLLIGHTEDGCRRLAEIDFGNKADRPVILALGPEAGWSEYDIRTFQQIGFQTITLGPRTLRVETALAVFLGGIELLRGKV